MKGKLWCEVLSLKNSGLCPWLMEGSWPLLSATNNTSSSSFEGLLTYTGINIGGGSQDPPPPPPKISKYYTNTYYYRV